jgi:hypothetical protein
MPTPFNLLHRIEREGMLPVILRGQVLVTKLNRDKTIDQ